MGGVPILDALTDLPLSMMAVPASKKIGHVVIAYFFDYEPHSRRGYVWCNASIVCFPCAEPRSPLYGSFGGIGVRTFIGLCNL